MYKINLDLAAEKDLKNISKVNMRKIAKLMDKISANPTPPDAKKSKATDEAVYCVKGDGYWIAYVIEKNLEVVNIRRIRNRKDVHRKL